MSITNEYDFELLKNGAETLVIAELDQQLEPLRRRICLCQDCVLDMAAMAMNTVKPFYRVSLLGTLYAAAAMDQEAYAKEIKTAVTFAIKKVSENPSHEIAATGA
jgi:competence protein ComFB